MSRANGIGQGSRLDRKPVTRRSPAPVTPPALRDPVVLDGVKYRIRSIAGELVTVRQTFGGNERTVPLAALSWDPVPALWRAPESAFPALDPYTAESVALADGATVGGAAGPAAAPPTLPPVTPGFCSDHPDLELLPHKRVKGVRWYGYGEDPATCCPSPEHDPYTVERCRFCGAPLAGRRGYPSHRRSFCSDKHRIYRFRHDARARAAAVPA